MNDEQTDRHNITYIVNDLLFYSIKDICKIVAYLECKNVNYVDNNNIDKQASNNSKDKRNNQSFCLLIHIVVTSVLYLFILFSFFFDHLSMDENKQLLLSVWHFIPLLLNISIKAILYIKSNEDKKPT